MLVGQVQVNKSDISSSPGVYQMLNKKNEVIYVGKADNLQNRIFSYGRNKNVSIKTKRMLSEVVKIETTLTKNSKNALLLEAELIKALQPKYNILLKDGKTFPFIVIDYAHKFPRIYKQRGEKIHKTFGPFTEAKKVNQVISELQTIFLLRSCSDSYFNARTRPCMLYQIKKCSAPCVGKIEENKYNREVKRADKLLSNQSTEVIEKLQIQMLKESNNQHYELAAKIRDKIILIQEITRKNLIDVKSYQNSDIVTFVKGKTSLLSISFIRNSMHYGISYYEVEVEELPQFLLQFYNKFSAPKHILLNFNLDEIYIELIKKTIKHRVSFKDIRNLKQLKHLYDIVISNTKHKLVNLISSSQKWEEELSNLQKLLGMAKKINLIEVYDNSHFSGSNPIGGFISATKKGFIKSAYRHFLLPNKEMDDHKILSHSILKRFASKSLKQYPELILIDGNRNQLNTVKNILIKLEIKNIMLLAIAKTGGRNKGTETLFTEDEVISLKKDSSTLHFLQKLRDEAHRNVITWNRKSIEKKISTSSLDFIPSIGKHRKQILLRHFGSYSNIKQASIYDLLMVKGINKKTADIIYKFIH